MPIIYPPHVAISKIFYNIDNQTEYLFSAKFVGSPRFFIESSPDSWVEIENYYSGEGRSGSLSTGSEWKWLTILGSGDVVTDIRIILGSGIRYKEFRIHEDYYENQTNINNFNTNQIFTSGILSTDIFLANLNRARITLVGSNCFNLQGSLTNFNGSWYPISRMGITEIAIGSKYTSLAEDTTFTGSGVDIMYKLYDPTGSSWIKSINVEWKSDDY